MPGFDRNRFVSITEEEVEDLTCSICHEIIKDPMTTNCCLQAYCGNCITEWLTNKTTCPYDRTPLTQTDLRPVPRLLKNMLGRLQITCDYEGKGCREVMRLDDLTKHLEECEFNKTDCDKCKCYCTVKHDCLTELLKFKSEHDKVLNELRLLKVENDELKNKSAGTSSGSTNINIWREMKHDEVSAYLRVLSSKKFTDEMLGKATSIIKKWMNSKAIQTNMDNIIMEIAFEFDMMFGASWNGFVYFDDHCKYFNHGIQEIEIKFKNFSMKFFKTTVTGDLLFYIIKRRKKLNKLGKLVVSKTNVGQIECQLLALSLKSKIFDCIEKSSTVKHFKTHITQQCKTLNDSEWQIAFSNYIELSINENEFKFMLFEIDELKAVIFRDK